MDDKKLRRLYERVKAGEGLSEKDREDLVPVALEFLGLEKTLRLLTQNKSFGQVRKIRDEWAPRLQVDPKLFSRAWHGQSLEDPE